MAHGRYTIIGKLADGGMAEIFLAMQHGAEGFQKPVVLKRILTAFSADPQFRNMFLDEAQISMSLNHGNIVQVLDVGIAGERTFLVLELVEGWDLEQVMERAQATGPDLPWPPSLALYVTAQICRGLAYAHAKRGPDGRPLGIVHRDVSPNNVLISEQGDVKLTDFGIAKAESKREQTLAGVIKGKIGFMSPEQALGRPLDSRADLFSVGTVMYLMLTGRRPFDAGSELESMMLAQKAEYRPPEELNPYLSPEATDIVKRAMQRDPEHRYHTADHMLVDVERVLRSQYHSAGQTELKSWLADLSHRDGVPPMGPRALAGGGAGAGDQGAGTGGGQPVFIDESGELSVGTSLELSDLDRTAAAAAATTAVAIQVPTPAGRTPRGSPARNPVSSTPRSVRLGAPFGVPTPTGVTPPPAHATPAPASSIPVAPSATSPPTGSPSQPFAAAPSAPVAAGAAQTTAPTSFSASQSSSASNPAGVAPPPPTGTATGIRLTKRSRVGLGFVLGAVCMLGAVFGIRWLAAWAGRERIEISSWYPPAAEPARSIPQPASGPSPSPAGSTGQPTPPGEAVAGPAGGAAPAAAGAGGAAAGLPTPSPPRPPSPAAVQPGDMGSGAALAAAGASDGGTTSASVPAGGAQRTAAAAEPASAAELDDDEVKLLDRVVPDGGGVVGADEAEDAPSSAGAASQGRSPGQPGAPGVAAAARTAAAPQKSPGRARAGNTAVGRTQPVQIRITTSPLGAVVRTKKQVLGRTPLAVRFNPGNTYELTFVKSGYVTKHRRLAVAPGKSHSISVAMKKAPTPRRGFFRGR